MSTNTLVKSNFEKNKLSFPEHYYVYKINFQNEEITIKEKKICFINATNKNINGANSFCIDFQGDFCLPNKKVPLTV